MSAETPEQGPKPAPKDWIDIGLWGHSFRCEKCPFRREYSTDSGAMNAVVGHYQTAHRTKIYLERQVS